MEEATNPLSSPVGWRMFVNLHSVWIFVAFTVLLTIAIVLLPLPTLIGPVLVVFIPALAAALIVRITDGKGSVRTQLFAGNAWRISLKWVAISLGLGIVLRLMVSMLGLLLIPGYQFTVGPIVPFLLALFVFAAGEEIGWRGFALPRLVRSGTTPLKAAFLLGIPWAFMHLSLLLPGKLSEGAPPLAYFLENLSLIMILTWLYFGARGSILAPVLLHGMQTAAVILNDGIPLVPVNWLMALAYTATAILIIIFTRGRLGLEPGNEFLTSGIKPKGS